MSFFLALAAVFFVCTAAQAAIVLKVIAVNPSQTSTQKVPVKVYLPKEAKPEDVLDRGDLELAYDNQQGSYYAYGEYELAPGQTLERTVEIRDIWTISAEEIESLRAESTKIESMLKNTEFEERIHFLKTSVDSKLLQIEEAQKTGAVNPERHISDYRDHVKILESVRADLALARNLLSQHKPFPMVTLWKIVVGIILFLGLLGASFYFIWQRQAGTLAQDPFYVPADDAVSPDSKPKRHEGGTPPKAP